MLKISNINVVAICGLEVPLKASVKIDSVLIAFQLLDHFLPHSSAIISNPPLFSRENYFSFNNRNMLQMEKSEYVTCCYIQEISL